MKEQFSAQVANGLHCLGCCARPCIVTKEDDSFRLMAPAFVLYVFFACVLSVCRLRLFFMKHVAPYTIDILQRISTALHPSATKNLITDRCSILEHASLLTFLFITKTLKLFILICKRNFIHVNKKNKKSQKN